MTMTRGSAEEKKALSAVLWAFALILWGASEAELLYAKAHESIHALWSMWAWYLPMMLILPSLTAIGAYFRFARTVSDADNSTASRMWSNLLADLLCVTNATLLVCVAILLNGKY